MGMGYSTTVVTRARELYAARFSVAEVARLLAKEFPDAAPAETTVRRWVDPDYAERQRETDRTGGVQTRRWGWKRRLRRIRELYEAGVDATAIAIIARLDFGLPLADDEVEWLIDGDGSEAEVRRLLGGAA